MTDYVTKQGKSKLNDKAMSSLLYAIVMCRARLGPTFGVGIYGFTRQQNRRHSYDFIVLIEKEMIPKFEELSGIELKNPIDVHVNKAR